MMGKGYKVIMISYYSALLSGSYITEPCECALFEFLIKKLKLHLVFNCYHKSFLYLYR